MSIICQNTVTVSLQNTLIAKGAILLESDSFFPGAVTWQINDQGG